MKCFLTFLLLINFNFFSAQIPDSTLIIIKEIGINFKERNEKLLLAYADSVNNFDGEIIPKFLNNPCFDFENIFNVGFHNRESHRWKILSKVNNIEALKSILEMDNKILKKVCKNKKGLNKKNISEISWIDLSFASLIQKRIDQLEYIANLKGNEKKHYDRFLLMDSIVNSLNNYNVDECIEIPEFFKEYDFDIKIGSKFWVSPQSAVSLRKLILGEVNNYQLLKCVLNSNDVNIKKINTISTDSLSQENQIPFQEYSTYELVKLRVEEIENNRKMRIGVMGIEN
jgi:hypothetical protein